MTFEEQFEKVWHPWFPYTEINWFANFGHRKMVWGLQYSDSLNKIWQYNVLSRANTRHADIDGSVCLFP